jgi:predicted AAA+ superfamily ATPase
VKLESNIPRFFKAPGQSFFLFGPRGTGKSTWLKGNYPDALWIDLLEPETYRSLSARPERLSELVLGNRDKKVVVIDEVQKIPELLSLVHALIERDKNRHFILTGSSARKLKKTGVDLLAGRLLLRTMHPFVAGELGSRFDLMQALTVGLVPLVACALSPPDVLRTYAALYVQEEVKMEGLTRNVGDFSRFLEAITFSHGGDLNLSNIARECEVHRKVVGSYIQILEDLLLSFTMPVFSKRAKRATVRRSKFYFFDAGVYRSLRPTGPLDRSEEIEGAALEGLVAQHLRAIVAYRNDDSRLYYWRTRSGLEVDLVLYGSNTFKAIEVKNTTRIRPADTRALRAFREEYPEAEAVLVYRGGERLALGDVLCVPVEEFLRSFVIAG